ncbi:TIGR03067 domain-containing protein [Thalassoroseus pseudoceratinae]|uniref:TIGR03067 domain-containing protein n=1 Tax=Thalassoroseus pseudoceratinae TaxID=2713176 RepID=UPI00142421BE|nr:TIGR03067 domain-containing protein [Thalassoroseus pseudoceratinae]
MIRCSCLLLLTSILASETVVAADQGSDLQKFQGKWKVVELVEDGKVVPEEAIRDWLPSGGQFEIAQNAIIFVSPHDGNKQVKLFSLDATQYPKGIDLSTREKTDGSGIYRFDNGKLIICFSDPDESKRPTEFSAKRGSKRLLMTLQRIVPEPIPAKKEPLGTTAKVLTDAQVTEMLKGSWRYTDRIGALFVTFNADGSFRTVREVKEIRLFQKVFVQSPVSTGKWSVAKGKLRFHIQTSVHPDRINKLFEFNVRSISERDFIFVDYLGRVGQASKVR